MLRIHRPEKVQVIGRSLKSYHVGDILLLCAYNLGIQLSAGIMWVTWRCDRACRAERLEPTSTSMSGPCCCVVTLPSCCEDCSLLGPGAGVVAADTVRFKLCTSLVSLWLSCILCTSKRASAEPADMIQNALQT